MFGKKSKNLPSTVSWMHTHHFSSTHRIQHMRSLRLTFLAAVFYLLSIHLVSARLMRSWTYQELLDRSDLVVIAKPSATGGTKEEIDLPGYTAMRVTGVETKFQISAVLKGEKNLKDFTLHHYRAAKPDFPYPNGPNLLSFDPSKNQSYILFLNREAGGRYAPTSGQTDPAFFAVHAIQGGIP